MLTLIIHGTFAEDETWWRLGVNSEPTFANRLEAALSKQGTVNTVWQPAIEAGLDYTDFRWSGKNKHSDRIKGAQKLTSTLRAFAEKTGSTRENPLSVNLVAHSHGGNVALEAMKYLQDNISINKVILLGTPPNLI